MIESKFILFKDRVLPESIVIEEISSTRLIDPQIEQQAGETWSNMLAEAKTKGAKLWDSTTYRLESCERIDDKIILKISTIPYSVRTALNKARDTIRAKNAQEQCDETSGKQYGATGMYSSTFVVTSDNYLVFEEKSGKYLTHKKISYVGGAYSKDEHVLRTGADFFSAAKKEIVEELGVQLEQVADFTCTGAYVTGNMNVCILFQAKLLLTSTELLEVFSQSGDGEAKALRLVPADDPMVLDAFKKEVDERDREKFDFFTG